MRDCVLHLADLHLGAAVSEALEKLDESAARGLAEARNALLDRLADWVGGASSRVGLVVIAGDLFDSHAPPAEVAQRTRQALAKMAAVVPVITVPGNHDEYSYPSGIYRRSSDSWPGLLVSQSSPGRVWDGELGGGTRVCVAAVTYEAGKTPPGGTPAFPPPEHGRLGIAVVHGTVQDYYSATVVEGERCFRVSHSQAAQAGYQYLAMGHIHRPRQWTKGTCLAGYPGPPVGPRPSDPGAGFVLLVQLGRAGPKWVPVEDPALVGPRWHVDRVAPDPGEKPKQLAARLAPRLPRDPGWIVALCLHCTVDRPSYAGELQEAFLERGQTVLVEADAVRIAPPPDLESLRREETFAGEFVRAWDLWRQSKQPDEATALRVLHEGLSALGRS